MTEMREVNNKDAEAIWEQALEVLQLMQMSTYALLSQYGHLRQISDREVHIGIVNQRLLNLAKPNQDKIEVAFSQVLGRCIKVTFEIAPLPSKIVLQHYKIKPVDKVSLVSKPSAELKNTKGTALATEAIWEQALQVLQLMQMSTYALLSQYGHLRQISDCEVHIGIVNQTLLNLAKPNQDKIEVAFSQVLGRCIKVTFEIAPLSYKTMPVPKTKEGLQSAVVVAFRPREAPTSVRKTKERSQSAVVVPFRLREEPSLPPSPTTTHDRVREAAEKLARFFNGVLIRLPDEGEDKR